MKFILYISLSLIACYFLSESTLTHEDDNVNVNVNIIKFKPAIDSLPDSISFISYISRVCYADGHAGNSHPSSTLLSTQFNWVNSSGESEICKKWYFHENYRNVSDQVGSIVYRPSVGHLVIGFRGSVYDKDWDRNVQKELVELDRNNICVHMGFKRRYNDIIPFSSGGIGNNAMLWNIHHIIDNERIGINNLQIIFTGHSAGAALATLGAFSLKMNGEEYGFNNLSNNQVLLITFSSPRVGNKYFSDEIEKRLGIVNILRFTCYSDTVPHIPPESIGYKHLGIEIPITTAEKVFDNNESETEGYLNYIRSTRFYKFIGYPVEVARNGISSVFLPLTGLSFLIMHSMPSDQLVVDALSYANTRYKSNDFDIRQIGHVPQVSSSRRFFYFF